MRRSSVAAPVMLLGLLAGTPALAQGGTGSDVVAMGKRATALVEVTAPGEDKGGSGTAFCIDRSGLFVTNAHVVEDAEGGKAEVRIVLEPGPDRKRQGLHARILRSDDRLDLALLKIDPVPGLAPLELGRDDRLSETMPVTTFGYPFGRALVFRRNGYPDMTILQSKITSLRRDEGRLEKIQFDNQLNPGNSGGPVLGPDGKVVGVAQATVKGSAINFAIPVGRLQGFLKAPAIVFNPPTLAYKDRMKSVTWTIKVQPSTPSATLPDGLSVSVKVATDVTPPRSFDTKAMGNGAYRVTLIPVPREAQTPVELRALIKGTWVEATVTDRDVRVGKTAIPLSDIREMREKPPRVLTRKNEVLVGEIVNLGKAKVATGRRGKDRTIDLSQASVIQVSPAAAAKPLRAIEAVVELKRGGEVIATKAKRLEFPDAPILLVDRNRGIGMIVQPPTPPVLRSHDPETENVKLVLGGPLLADGQPRGAGLSIRPPDVPMGDALLDASPESAEEIRRFAGHGGPIWGVAIDPEGKRILTASHDYSVRLWELETGVELRRLAGHSDHVKGVAFTPDGRRAISGADDDTLRLWDLNSGREILCLRGHSADLSSVAVSPDGLAALSGANDNTVRHWDLARGRQLRCLLGHSKPISGVAFLPDGKRAVSASQDGTIRLWGLTEGRELRRFSDGGRPVSSVAVSADGCRAISGHSDGIARVWDLENGKLLMRLSGHQDAIGSVAFSPDGRRAVTAGGAKDPSIRVWDLAGPREVGRIGGFSASIYSIVLTPDGRAVASGGQDAIGRLSGLPEVDAKVPLPAPPLVRQLDAKLTDLVVGGGGRYLILTLKEARQVAIFDVNVAKIVKQIDVPSDDVLVAAGARKLILLFPKIGLFQRWDLPSLALELKGEKQPIRGLIRNLAMGSDSDGPMLAFWSVQRSDQPGAMTPARCSFIDPITLKVLKIDPARLAASGFGAWTSEGSFRIYCQSSSDRIRLRASPGGGLFGSWCISHGPAGIQTIALDGRSVRLDYLHEDAGHVVPGLDGKTFFTGRGDRRGPDGKPLNPSSPPSASREAIFPSTDPSYYLGVAGLAYPNGQASGRVAATVRLTSNGEEVLTVHNLAEMAGASTFERADSDEMSLDRRFHLIPAANLLITVPTSNDRLVLRRLSLDEGIARSGKSILAVTSTAELSARPGQRLAHQVQVRSSQGGVAFELTLGPEGVSVSPEGVLKWDISLTAEKKEYETVLTVGDASGRKTFHTIRIKVE